MLGLFVFLKSKLSRYVAYKIITSLDPQKYFENSIKLQNIPAARWIIKNFDIKVHSHHYGSYRVESLPEI
jgi:hypothetical protein